MNSGWWFIVGMVYGWIFAPFFNGICMVFINAYREYKKEENK